MILYIVAVVMIGCGRACIQTCLCMFIWMCLHVRYYDIEDKCMWAALLSEKSV